MHKKLFLVGALTSLIFVGCEDSPSGSADEIKFTAHDEPPGPNCREGGSRLEIQRGEKVDLVYLCHPAQGSGAISVSEAGERCPHGGSLIHIEGAEPIALCDGKDGSPPATLIVEPIEPGEECASGGASIRVGEGEPILVCQGHTETVSIATEPPGENCAAGGIKLEVGSREPVFICSGLDGEGVTLSPEPPGEQCPRGGVKITAGESVRYVCHGDALSWHQLTADASAEPNAGYIDATDGDLTLTLPPSEALRIGDTLRVIHTGGGTLSITPRADQTFRYPRGSLAVPTTFFPRGPERRWTDCSISADGSTILASYRQGLQDGGLVISKDGGMTWEECAPESLIWYTVASSADGQRLAAGVHGGYLFVSEDGGETWIQKGPFGSWKRLFASNDGRIWVAIADSGHLARSVDFGQSWSWTQGLRLWMSVAGSADGKKLILTSSNPRNLFLSEDGGVTLVERFSEELAWLTSASSGDGRILLASGSPSRIWVSTDAGVSWTQRGESNRWVSMSTSIDGSTLVAASGEAQLYFSYDTGATWVPRGPNRHWKAVSVSGDGARAAACAPGDHIYVNGGTGSLVMREDALVELTYTGNGEFYVSEVGGTVDEP